MQLLTPTSSSCEAMSCQLARNLLGLAPQMALVYFTCGDDDAPMQNKCTHTAKHQVMQPADLRGRYHPA